MDEVEDLHRLTSKTPLTCVICALNCTAARPQISFLNTWGEKERQRKPFHSLPFAERQTESQNKKELKGECISAWAASIKCKQKQVPFCWCWCSVAGHPAFVDQGREGSPSFVTFTPSPDRAPLTAVMDVRKCCSCLCTNKRDETEANTRTERCIWDGVKE